MSLAESHGHTGEIIENLVVLLGGGQVAAGDGATHIESVECLICTPSGTTRATR